MENEIDYQKVLRRSITRLLDDLYPQPILDQFMECDFLPATTIRDIQELRTTTEKNRAIVDKVRGKGAKGYQNFKKILRRCSQGHIADFLERKEMEIKNEPKKSSKPKPTQPPPKSSKEKNTEINQGTSYSINAFPGANVTVHNVNFGGGATGGATGTGRSGAGAGDSQGRNTTGHQHPPAGGRQSGSGAGAGDYNRGVPPEPQQQPDTGNSGTINYNYHAPNSLYITGGTNTFTAPMNFGGYPSAGLPWSFPNQQAMRASQPYSVPPNHQYYQQPFSGQTAQVRQDPTVSAMNQSGWYAQATPSYLQPQDGGPAGVVPQPSPPQGQPTGSNRPQYAPVGQPNPYTQPDQAAVHSGDVAQHNLPQQFGRMNLTDRPPAHTGTQDNTTQKTNIGNQPDRSAFGGQSHESQSSGPPTDVSTGQTEDRTNRQTGPGDQVDRSGGNNMENDTNEIYNSQSQAQQRLSGGASLREIGQTRPQPPSSTHVSMDPVSDQSNSQISTKGEIRNNQTIREVGPDYVDAVPLKEEETLVKHGPSGGSSDEQKTESAVNNTVNSVVTTNTNNINPAMNIEGATGGPTVVSLESLNAPRPEIETPEGLQDPAFMYSGGRESDLPSTTETVKHNKLVDIDDGRVLDVKWEAVNKILEKSVKLDSGRFGEVYKSRDVHKDWNIRVAVKIIPNSEIHNTSVRNEIIAGRIRHHSIVPLLAKCTHEGNHYFLFPYMEGGNLLDAMKKSKQLETQDIQGENRLTAGKIIKILYQIASAIQYIHTEVPKLRKEMVHGDIQSKNIVLNGDWSAARLLDFGVARQLNESGQAPIRSGDPIGAYTTRIANQFLNQSTDIKHFGIVILEMLTNYHNPEELKKYTDEMIDDLPSYLPSYVRKPACWNSPAVKGAYISLKEIAKKCKKNGTTAQQIADDLGELRKTFDSGTETGQNTGYSKCSMCMLNYAVASVQNLKLEGCESSLNHPDPVVCVACMRNSYINPIQCKVCRKTVQTKIGLAWAAILITGYDKNDQDVFREDVKSIKKLLTSKYPLVTGLSENNVFETTMDNLEATITDLNNKPSIECVFIYYSGHCTKHRRFEVGRNERGEPIEVSNEIFNQNICNIKEEVKDFILAMDCCYSDSLEYTSTRIFRRFNSAKSDQRATYNKRSLFTHFFIQSMRGKSTKTPCLLLQGIDQAGAKQTCDLCKSYKPEIDRGFISVAGLFDNIDKHMKEFFKIRYDPETEPTFMTDTKEPSKLYIGYYLDREIPIEFKSVDRELTPFKCEELPPECLDLKCYLLKEVLKTKYSVGEASFSSTDHPWYRFSCIIAIRAWTYPHRDRSDSSDNRHGEMVELLEMPQISEALNQKLELFYEVRKLEDICNGPVGKFTDFKTSDLVSRCEQLEEFKKNDTINETVLTIDCKDVGKVIAAVGKVIAAIQQKNTISPECNCLLFLRDNLLGINREIALKEKTGTLKITIPLKGLWNEGIGKSEDFLMFEFIDTPPGEASSNAAVDQMEDFNQIGASYKARAGTSGVGSTQNDVPDGRMPEVTDNESNQQAERAVEKRKGTRETAV